MEWLRGLLWPRQADATPVASRAERRGYRIDLLRRQLPPTMIIGGVIMLVLGIVFRLNPDNASDWAGFAYFVSSLIMFIFGVAARRMTVAVLEWAYAVAMFLILGPFLVRAGTTGSPEIIGTSAVLALALVSMSVAWRPILVAWLALTVLDVAIVRQLPGYVPNTQMTTVVLLAMLFGMGLLIVRIRTVDRLADLSVYLRNTAMVDSLTGLLNRHGLARNLQVLVGLARRERAPICAVYLDVDGLKAVNDTYGHDEGDKVLRAVGEALVECSRRGDLVARLGGDEFVVVGVGDHHSVQTLAYRVETTIREMWSDKDLWDGRVSVGTAFTTADELNLDTLLSLADEAMYSQRRIRRSTP